MHIWIRKINLLIIIYLIIKFKFQLNFTLYYSNCSKISKIILNILIKVYHQLSCEKFILCHSINGKSHTIHFEKEFISIQKNIFEYIIKNNNIILYYEKKRGVKLKKYLEYQIANYTRRDIDLITYTNLFYENSDSSSHIVLLEENYFNYLFSYLIPPNKYFTIKYFKSIQFIICLNFYRFTFFLSSIINKFLLKQTKVNYVPIIHVLSFTIKDSIIITLMIFFG